MIGVGLGVGLGSGASPRPPVLTRIAATRGQVMNNATLAGGGATNYTRLESIYRIKTGPDGMADPTARFEAFYYNVGQIAQPTDATLEFAYQVGTTVTKATFGGNPTGALIAGTALYSADPLIGLTIPPNTEIFAQLGIIIPSGAQFMLGGVVFSGIGEACYLSTSATSLIGTPGPWTLPSGGVASGSHGAAIFITSTGVKSTKAILLVGDSEISAKGLDAVGDGHGNIGFLKPALYAAAGGPYPFADYARLSSEAFLYGTQTGWRSALDYVDVMICNLGTNDLAKAASGNYTTAATKSYLMTIWAAAKAKGVKVVQALILPRTTGTWSDAAGQTPLPRFVVGGDRDALNTWIRAQKGTLIDDVLDILPYVEDQGVPSVWAPSITGDGIHPTLAWRSLTAVVAGLLPPLLA
jgi:hypothetical protein